MKKIIYIYCLFFSFIGIVNAVATKNGVPIKSHTDKNNLSVTVTCRYKSGNEIILTREDKDDTEGECNSFGDPGECLKDGGFLSKEDNYLKSKGFLDNNGSFDCPKYALWKIDQNNKVYLSDYTNSKPNTNEYFELNPSASTCVGACLGEQYGKKVEANWNCDYTGTNNKKVQTSFDGTSYWLTGDDGIKYKQSKGDIQENCGDFFYQGGDTGPLYVSYNILKSNNAEQIKKWYTTLCSEDKLNYTYFCSGSCKFSDNKSITCSALKKSSGGGGGISKPTIDLTEICNDSGVKKGLKFVGSLIFITKICVPLLLIIMGVLDFSKAFASSDADAVPKGAKRFAIRLIAGIAIFVLPTIISLLFNLIPTSNGFEQCGSCVFNPNSCK